MSIGYRVMIEGNLFKTDEGGLKEPIAAGSHSIAFMFERLGGGEPVGLGAFVERVDEGGAPGGDFRAVIAFWGDLSEVYATPGTKFDLWLGRIVGRGVVKEIVV